MSRTLRHLSKSRFLSGRQCELRLWYEVKPPALALEPDPVARAIMDTGLAVGVLARERYPGGVLVDTVDGDLDAAIAATAELLSSGGVPAVFEGAFRHRGVTTRADILVRGANGAWDLVEVKSSTRCKAIHEIDLALQAWVLDGAGVDLGGTSVLTLDRDYVWPGGELDLDALFQLHDRSEVVAALKEDVAADVDRFAGVLKARTGPDIETGPHCTTPYACPYLDHCCRDQVVPDWPLSDLPALGSKRREALEEMGIDDIRDIPEDFELGVLQSVARDAVLAGEEVIHGDLRRALAQVRAPVHNLDFECMSPAIPRFSDTCAYEQVPFQFSVHTEHADGTLEHREYLHPDATDPREALSAALLEALGDEGSVVVYSGFEKTVMTALATALPQFAAGLEAAQARIWDLHAIIRGSYYHPDFRGSFSIKKVLPTLVPDLDYSDLEISDGALASLEYERALGVDVGEGREAIFDALRSYCARDTLGLVRIRCALGERLSGC